MAFDINNVIMPWSRGQQQSAPAVNSINLENVTELYKTELLEEERTDFAGTFGTDHITNLNDENYGGVYDPETGSTTFNLKDVDKVNDAKKFYNTLLDEEKRDFICKKMGVSEEEYDAIACISMAIASQETGMGFEKGYQEENRNYTLRKAAIYGLNLADKLFNDLFDANSASSGLTQLKIYDHMESDIFKINRYSEYLENEILGVEASSWTNDNLDETDKSAVATMVALVSLYKQYEDYSKDMNTYNSNLEAELVEKYQKSGPPALEIGYETLSDIYEVYQTQDPESQKDMRHALKQWFLSRDGSTKENKASEGDSFTEEIQLEKLNSYLPQDKQITQDKLDFIRFFLTNEKMQMTPYEYMAYAWNKGTDNTPDRIMSEQMGIIFSDPEVFDYEHYTANVIALAERYANQGTGNKGYEALETILGDKKID